MTDWMPGAEIVVGAHGGGTLVGGPPRCTWHITWCHLDPRPTFDNVRDYLVRMNYEPTLLWDPEDGRVAEFLPASRSAYAVRNLTGGVETNRYGDVHVQIEVFFSPGYQGRALFTDGPVVGLDKIMAWLDGLSIPRVAAGDWAHPDRDVNRWLTQPGHYGHFEVPENNHEDPIAGTDIAKILSTGLPAPAPVPVPPVDLKEYPMRFIAQFPDTSGYLVDTQSGFFLPLTAAGAQTLIAIGVPLVAVSADVGDVLPLMCQELRQH